MNKLAPIRAAVLIGGASRRMGRPKQNMELAGRTFLDRIVGVLRDCRLDITLVGAGEPSKESGTLPRIADVDGLRGPPAGIVAALRHDSTCAWLVVACDLPLIAESAVKWLIAQRTERRIAVMPRVVSEYVEPLFACYEPEARPVVEGLAARGGARLQELAARDDVVTPDVPAELRDAWQNVNTLADVEVARVMSEERARK